jgi:hypothetical protein
MSNGSNCESCQTSQPRGTVKVIQQILPSNFLHRASEVLLSHECDKVVYELSRPTVKGQHLQQLVEGATRKP